MKQVNDNKYSFRCTWCTTEERTSDCIFTVPYVLVRNTGWDSTQWLLKAQHHNAHPSSGVKVDKMGQSGTRLWTAVESAVLLALCSESCSNLRTLLWIANWQLCSLQPLKIPMLGKLYSCVLLAPDISFSTPTFVLGTQPTAVYIGSTLVFCTVSLARSRVFRAPLHCTSPFT